MNPHASSDDRQASADALRQHLLTAKALRQQAKVETRTAHQHSRLRAWQAGRLARTHADLLGSERFDKAARFFLSDLYGPKDFSRRDEEVERILPLLIKMLPASALYTVALAVELDALTERLDAAMVQELANQATDAELDEVRYAAIYRAVGLREQRLRQIELIGQIGGFLERLARKPLLTQLLKLMRQPAQAAGLGDLQEFLERGFLAFRHMGPARQFLETIEDRERRLLENLFSGATAPFV
ncbi:MAG TPA: hypothetical protein PKN13_04910 [Accumulibacter sp.]|nr:hypothetical protein [Accumulibacter sp.]HMW17450.1 hypothetical protein [Accumulibacter sp.]HNC17988.1 hypothetical protein [Accumulibacter sp.]HND79921.1 hypothetical protein [Accumulibacter sp.]HNE12470.1 hypothetical protein [Accumulibacter sp.]